MTFLNPNMLPWILAALLPIIIHWLTKTTLRKAELPTAKFLSRATAGQTKLQSVRDWLILALRAIALTAFILAFAKPALQTALPPISPSALTLILIDSGASMNYRDEVNTRYSSAISQAKIILNKLPTQADINVILFDSKPKLLNDAERISRSELIALLNKTAPTLERTEPTNALAFAESVIANNGTKNVRMFIISDFQRSKWADAPLEPLSRKTSMALIPIGKGSDPNVGIVSLKTTPTVPKAGEPFTLQCVLFNSSGQQKTVNTIVKSATEKTSKIAAIQPYSSVEVAFQTTANKPGFKEITVEINKDNLQCDDVRYAAIEIGKRKRALIVSNQDVNDSASALFFTIRALQPRKNLAEGFETNIVKPNMLNTASMKGWDAVVLCGINQPSQLFNQHLAEYLQEGGAVIWMMTDSNQPAAVNRFMQYAFSAQPPIHATSIINVENKGRGYVRISDIRNDSKLSDSLKSHLTALTDVNFRQFCLFNNISYSVKPLMLFDDGSPALAQTTLNKGQLLLWNMSPAPHWSDLAKSEMFVPLLYEAVNSILPQSAGIKETHPGNAPCVMLEKGLSSVKCTNAAMQTIPIVYSKETGSTIAEEAQHCGFIRFFSNNRLSAVTAVNVHSDISDLRTVDLAELNRAWNKKTGDRTEGAKTVILDNIGAGVADEPEPIQHWFIITALLLFITEQALSNLTFQRKAKA